MNVRELTSHEEFEACLELQREGFGWEGVELMPIRFFVVSRYIGGLVLGAFEGEQLIGFLSAIPGVRDGSPYWHSHMLAVAGASRDAGVGTRLKHAQKDEALRRGIRLIEWTFDPLESKNAHLNIEKLGVVVRRYYPDFYGPGSDRVIAEWWLDRPRSSRGLEAHRLTIPADSKAARGQRLKIREEFLASLAKKLFVGGFERRGESSDYVFFREPSGADRAN